RRPRQRLGERRRSAPAEVAVAAVGGGDRVTARTQRRQDEGGAAGAVQRGAAQRFPAVQEGNAAGEHRRGGGGRDQDAVRGFRAKIGQRRRLDRRGAHGGRQGDLLAGVRKAEGCRGGGRGDRLGEGRRSARGELAGAVVDGGQCVTAGAQRDADHLAGAVEGKGAQGSLPVPEGDIARGRACR